MLKRFIKNYEESVSSSFPPGIYSNSPVFGTTVNKKISIKLDPSSIKDLTFIVPDPEAELFSIVKEEVSMEAFLYIVSTLVKEDVKNYTIPELLNYLSNNNITFICSNEIALELFSTPGFVEETRITSGTVLFLSLVGKVEESQIVICPILPPDYGIIVNEKLFNITLDSSKSEEEMDVKINYNNKTKLIKVKGDSLIKGVELVDLDHK